MDALKLTIGQLAGELGVATSALRYYEEAGLLGPGERSSAGYRLYKQDAVGRLQFIQRAKALGLTLKEIRQLVNGPHADGQAERSALRHVLAHKIAQNKARILELEILGRELERLYVRQLRPTSAECGHIGNCACWLPTDEEVMTMATEVACCRQSCCPSCSCTGGEPCDCAGCLCAK